MRAIWTGSLSFGLINVPVRMYSGSESKGGLSFRQLDKKNLTPIKYVKVNRETGEEVPREDIVKGYEYRKGDYIILSEKDFERASHKRRQTIDIKQFADQEEIDIRYYEKPYYLEPQEGAEMPYALLVEALKLSGEMAITKYVLRNRDHLGAIVPAGKLLVLNQMRFKSEVRSPEGLNLPEEAPPQEDIDLALRLIEQLTRPFEAEKYKDTYTEQLRNALTKKKAGKPASKKGKKAPTGASEDLMASLKASLQEVQAK